MSPDLTCLVCSEAIGHLAVADRNAHVNACLDSSSDGREGDVAADEFQCWICEQRCRDPINHLTRCTGLPREQVADIIKQSRCDRAEIFHSLLICIDQHIKRLTNLKQFISSHTAPARSDEVSVVLEDSCAVSICHATSTTVPRSSTKNRSSKPMPDYNSMTIPELKKAMSAYGLRAGSRVYMIDELLAAWKALHPSDQPASSSSKTDVVRRGLDRSNSITSSSSSTGKAEKEEETKLAVLEFIRDHEALHEHLLCMKSIDSTELYESLRDAGIPASRAFLDRFCRDQGINVVNKRKK